MATLRLKILALLVLLAVLWTAVPVSASPTIEPRFYQCPGSFRMIDEILDRVDIPDRFVDYHLLSRLGNCTLDAPVLIIPVVSAPVLSPAS